MSDEVVIIDEDYFMSAPDEMVEYLTDQGTKAVKRMEDSFTAIRVRSQLLANILIAGIGGSAMLFLNTWDKGNVEISLGLLIIIFGWIGCLIFLTRKALNVRERPTAFGTPLQLYDADNPIALKTLLRRRLYDYSDSCQKIGEVVTDISRAFNTVVKWTMLTTALAVASVAICTIIFWIL